VFTWFIHKNYLFFNIKVSYIPTFAINLLSPSNQEKMKIAMIIFFVVCFAVAMETRAAQLTGAGCLQFNSTTIAWFRASCPSGQGMVMTRKEDDSPLFDESEMNASNWDDLLMNFNLIDCCSPGDRIGCLAPGNAYMVGSCINGKSCCATNDGEFIGCDWLCN
jgi:hypothetical protein